MKVGIKINEIVGCIMASYLDDKTKEELIDFIWELAVEYAEREEKG